MTKFFLSFLIRILESVLNYTPQCGLPWWQYHIFAGHRAAEHKFTAHAGDQGMKKAKQNKIIVFFNNRVFFVFFFC